MPFRKKIKNFATRLKEGTRRIFGDERISVQSTNSVPDLQRGSLSVTPAPSSLRVPADPFTRPTSAPPSSAQLTRPNEALTSTSVSPATSPLPQTAAVLAPSSSTPAPPNDQTPEADTTQSVEPISSFPDPQIPSSSVVPAPSALAVPAGTNPVPEPASTPSTSAQSTEPNEPPPSISVPQVTSLLPKDAGPDPSSSESAPAPPKGQPPEADAQPLRPTNPVPDLQTSSSSAFPTPSPLIVPAITDPVTRSTSTPPHSAQLTGPDEHLPNTGVPPATGPLARAAVPDLFSSPRPAPATPNARSGENNTSQLVQPTDSVPDLPFTSSSTGPAPSTLASPAVTDPVASPRSAPASVEQTGAGTGWKCFKGFLRVLNTSSGAIGPLKPVMDDLVQCFALHEDAAAARQGYAELKAQLEAVFSDLSHHFSGNVPPSLITIMDNLCGAIERELDRIANKEERQAWRRHFEAKRDLDEVMDCYRRIHGHLERLNLNANINTWKTVDEIATEDKLRALRPSMSACYNSAEAAGIGRRDCTPKTREQVLADLGYWRYDKQQGNIFWLNGMAGTGKTTIANTLCAMLDRSHELGASFFCTRLRPECRDVKLIFPSIAYQLARFSCPFRFALSRSLERDPDIHTRALTIQLEGLIAGPLREIARTLPQDLVVVIDALDECEDSNGVSQMLQMLADHARDLPLKMFVSSRPEPQIRDKIGDLTSKIVLHELDNKIVKDDIEAYLRAELANMSIAESDLAILVERAGVLFIYAATVVRYIKPEAPQVVRAKRLKTILSASATVSSTPDNSIDVLYSTILDAAFHGSGLDDEDRARMKLVLDTVICAQEPLTADALSGLLQLGGADWAHFALQPLWSVLHISGANGFVTTLHASFPDYMFDLARSREHACGKESHHGRLTELCFERIEVNDQQFNICQLESSYVFDDQVPDLDERVKRSIPLDLSYACQYWAVHLELGGSSPGRMQLLESFLSKRLLLWMEVLNLRKKTNVGALLLEKTRKWCTNQDGPEATQGLIHDAWRFTTTFAANPVSRSTPHLYVSMLLFWPSSKLIADFYVKRARGFVEVGGSGMARRQLALLGVFPVGSPVESVVFSPDGTRIICGCYDETIRVWDAQSGKAVLGPLEGHTERVFSVACSPDGLRIASGSEDKTIRVWDARSGEMALEPLEGHTGGVYSVAFSPDSARIVSGSYDETIRVWDAQTGRVVLGPLEGHSSAVLSVAISPDGMRIVSGSSDNTIRVWDSQSGRMVLGPLTGHTDSVYSVAFSPDSTRIVCGSSDKTIRVWDAQTGQTILGPLEGHTDLVHAVAYSSNGTHIVSGSDDNAIRMWDARSGQLVLGPLEGHTGRVTSLAFSPDGMRIVSGSWDQTIRVWDAQSREVSLEPLDGHTESVFSVAFTPDGRHIASGSGDRTIRVWDVQSGEMVLGPLEGHTQSVYSVAFSPDGTRIASGSWDNTIRIWDSQNGKLALQPLEGHERGVLSVVFSPDSTRIVSGSDDNQIRVWDVRSGNMVLGPLEGHTGSVLSVAVSLDGRWIVSGADDRAIRVWDAQNGRAVLGPLEGHGRVFSVALSPDSTRIVSGSGDNTIRVWDAQTGQMALEPLAGHTGLVLSVAFSPNGMYIVSGSDDKTIRVWSAQTGELVLGPLHGHIEGVLSTSFSPDSTLIVSGSDDKAIRVWRLPSPPSTDNSAPRSPADPSASHSGAKSHIHSPSAFHQASSRVIFSHPPDEDGWLVNEDQHVLLWVPPDLRNFIVMPHNTLVISRQGSVQINFDGASIGESWAKCYTPA